MTTPDNIEVFSKQFRASFEGETFDRLVLSAPTKDRNSGDSPRKQTLRPIELKGNPMVQWELQFDQQQSQLNLSLEESLQRLAEIFGKQYREAYLFTTESETILRTAKQGTKLKTMPRTRQIPKRPREHNRSKNYLIPEGVPCSFLQALGIMSGSGRVRESKQKKFRQINRYLEIVDDVYSQLPSEGTLRIVDFGCGLSYLTFAVHHLLTQIHKRDVELFGIDQKADVIERCQLLAHDLNFDGLHFSTGKIEEAEHQGKVHLALSLHACDSATDAVLAFAVQAEADVIMAVPCCQHEVFPQIANENLRTIFEHGILKERVAAIATDALRAAALKSIGYKTQIIEFIDLEHTPKNLLIRAVRKKDSQDPEESSEYQELKRFFHIETLATDQILRQKPAGSPVEPAANS